MMSPLVKEATEDSPFLRELIEPGPVRVVIDRRCPLVKTADARRYVESGHESGYAVMVVEHNSRT